MSNRKSQRAFDHWLEAYVDHQRFSESPVSFHFWTGVATIAGALRRKVWIDERHYQWTPNMYVILVGPPGVAAKSTSIRAGLSLLEAVPGIHFGPQTVTWQALIESFAQAQVSIPIPGQSEPATMSCLTIGVGELGTFLRPENREFLDLLTAMWDGQKEALRRRTRMDGETVIHNPWLNIIGCTTPAWLKDNFPDVLIGGGLTSRIVFVYGDKKRQLIAYPSRNVDEAAYHDEEKYLIHDLSQIAKLAGPYRLTEEAYKWGESWYEQHNTGPRPAHVASDRFDGYLFRKQTHIHKLAMVLAAAQRDELVVTDTDLQQAADFTTGLEGDMLRVFSSIGVTQAAKVTTEVLNLIRNHKSLTYQELWKLCIGTLDPKTVKESVVAAIDAGYVRKDKLENGDYRLTYIKDRKP